MDRPTWLGQRRAAVLACYDKEASAYDAHGYPTQTQQNWVARLLRACPAGSMILDAPCGTGKYFMMVAAAGHRVACADQSGGEADSGPGTALPSRSTRSGSRNWTISASSTPS